jgi:glycosyltransferase involved in cell wall biosynthesis
MNSGLFSVVVAVFNVEHYLNEFLESLERQTFPFSALDIILIDDESTDGSLDIIRAWQSRYPGVIRQFAQKNGGPGSARNAGLDLARNRWVTFSDPDDILDEGYFLEAARFLQAHEDQGVQLLTANMLILDEAIGQVRDTHPLRSRFSGGNQLVNLECFPSYIHLAANAGFYRREQIERLRLRFDERVRPTFEDAHFTARYLIGAPEPLVGCVASARYLYRKRADNTSLVQSGWSRPEKYVNVLKHGYLGALQEARARLGRVPLWLQNTVLYDLLWYFRTDERMDSATGGLPAPLCESFHELVGQILTHIDVETIEGFDVVKTHWGIREALISGYKCPGRRPDFVIIEKLDPKQQLVKVRYRFSGDLPVEEFRIRGQGVVPLHGKVRSVQYFRRTLTKERIAWLSANGTLRVSLDGRPMHLSIRGPREPTYSLRPDMMWRSLGHRRPRADGSVPGQSTPPSPLPMSSRSSWAERQERWRRRVETKKDEATRALARSPRARRLFADAWVFMDRDVQAQDNAEHLYRHVRRRHPDINAWFVLCKDSPDWPRLAAEGFKLVPYGSRRWVVLLLNAAHLVSSHADDYVVRPLDERRFGRGTWRFTFLQHGVIFNDLSRWFNRKPIDLLVTSTVAEHQSIAGDGSPYGLTSKEVRLTGLPRHDALLEKAANVPRADRRLLLVMPTWRRSLLGKETGRGNEREVLSSFWQSDYARNWLDLLSSDRLHEVARAHDLRIAFMPHPNMQVYLADANLPAHVEVFRYADTDVQQVLARGAAMVTDYSSLAFEMAFLLRPVVYFQFDRESFFGGDHIFRPGYFDFERDGFGPVVTEAHGAVQALAAALAQGSPDREYLQRMDTTFPFRDGRCSRRVVREIRRLNEPVSFRKASRAPLPPAAAVLRLPSSTSVVVS